MMVIIILRSGLSKGVRMTECVRLDCSIQSLPEIVVDYSEQ